MSTEITEEMLTAVLRVLPIDPDDSTTVVRVDYGGQPIWGDPHRLAKDIVAAAWPHMEAAVRRDVPSWLAALVAALTDVVENTACNNDHDTNDGCDWCAWDALLAAVPHTVKAQVYRSGKTHRELLEIARGDDGE